MPPVIGRAVLLIGFLATRLRRANLRLLYGGQLFLVRVHAIGRTSGDKKTRGAICIPPSGASLVLPARRVDRLRDYLHQAALAASSVFFSASVFLSVGGWGSSADFFASRPGRGRSSDFLTSRPGRGRSGFPGSAILVRGERPISPDGGTGGLPAPGRSAGDHRPRPSRGRCWLNSGRRGLPAGRSHPRWPDQVRSPIIGPACHGPRGPHGPWCMAGPRPPGAIRGLCEACHRVAGPAPQYPQCRQPPHGLIAPRPHHGQAGGRGWGPGFPLRGGPANRTLDGRDGCVF
jgi:hypothetical protein